jgi:hypothetical protein
MTNEHRDYVSELEELRKRHKAAVANGLHIKAKRLARQIAAVERKMDKRF